MVTIIILLAISVVVIHVLRFHAFLIERRFRLTIINYVALLLAYLLVQPLIAGWFDRLTPSFAGALWLSNLGSMTSAACAVQLYVVLYYGSPLRGRWVPHILVVSGIGTTLSLMFAGPHVSLMGALSASSGAGQHLALLLDRGLYTGFMALMVVLLTQIIWRQRQHTRDRISRISLSLLLCGCGCAAPYLGTALGLGFPNASATLMTWNALALNALIACFFFGSLLPMVPHEQLIQNGRLMLAAIRLYPLWHDMTQRVAGVKYTAVAWQSCWHDPAQTALLVRRYTIESYNAAQVILDEWEIPRAALDLPLHVCDRARADAACYVAFAQGCAPDCATQTLLRGFPYSDHRNPTDAIQYLELVAHYYVSTGVPAQRYRWWMALEWLIGHRSLYRPLTSLEIAR